MFQLQNVSKSYGSKTALHPISLAIETAQTTALIGPSGCGKSTLLRLLMGLLEPDEGTILFEQTALNSNTINAVRHQIGYVIQEGGLFPHLTSHENVVLTAVYLKWKPEAIAARVSELADLVQLPQELLSRYPAQLSGGQRQRVSLMRALMLDPAVLLLDEPLGALDPMIRVEMQNDLKQIFGRLGKTVVIVTHDLHEAAFFAQTVLLFRQGRLVQSGSINEFISQPANDFVTKFVSAQQAHWSGGQA